MTLARRDPTILFALLAALAVHLALIGFGVKIARRDLGWWLPSQPAMATPPATVPRLAPNDPMQQLGDHDTHGQSINSAPGDQAMESPFANAQQEQAAVQRDPAGYGGKGESRQLEQMLRGDNGDNSPRGSSAGSQSAAAVFGSRESSLAELAPKVSTPVNPKSQPAGNSTGAHAAIDPLSSGPLAMKPDNKSAAGQQSDVNPSPSDQNANQQTGSQQSGASSATGGGAGGRAGAPDPGAGNPMPTSDFESNPVTHVAGRLVAGRIEARTGRKMRTRELPKLGLAAYADLENMDRPYVTLDLKIDTTGNVIDAEIKHSSGSDDVDLPCQRAACTWWFEPLKDPKTGQVHPEEMEFTIYFF
jgi:TonB family protein